ncbi:hypothetical protein [Symbioplanes lichenis]|uniref:hypothetical protein n=1 Tax=Symbioplanes lichenis TaxID=1629072 RepID=UPI002738775F|nr:hypothetical protein [Actinoplanes lichenis]
MRNRSIKAGVAALVVAGGLLSGCGSTDSGTSTAPGAAAAPSEEGNGVAALEPAEILSRSKAAVDKAGSYTLSGTLRGGGQEFTLDLSVGGDDLVGNILVGSGRVQLLRAHGQEYVRPDAAFLTATGAKRPAAMVAELGDKWAAVPASNPTYASLFALADADQLLTATGTLTKGEEGEIHGSPAVGVVDSADGGVLYVATSGEPYPLSLQAKDPKEGSLTFSGFGATVQGATPPATTQVVELSELG